jgi:hypothetical protein
MVKIENIQNEEDCFCNIGNSGRNSDGYLLLVNRY